MGERLVAGIYPNPKKIEATVTFLHAREARIANDFSGVPGGNSRDPSLGSLAKGDSAGSFLADVNIPATGTATSTTRSARGAWSSSTMRATKPPPTRSPRSAPPASATSRRSKAQTQSRLPEVPRLPAALMGAGLHRRLHA